LRNWTLIALACLLFTWSSTAFAVDDRVDLIGGVVDKLNSSELEERLKAGLALQELIEEKDATQLASALKAGNTLPAQLLLIESMSTLPSASVREALRFELEQGEPEAKRAAVRALGKLRDDWAVPILTKALISSSDARLKIAAASALGEIDSNRSLYALKNAAPHVQGTVKLATAWAIAVSEGKVELDVPDKEITSGRNIVAQFKGMQFYFYAPSYRPAREKQVRALVCIHDEDLRVQQLFNVCRSLGKKHRLAVIAPFFDPIAYPDYGTFNLTGKRADLAFFELIDFLAEGAELETREMFMFGLGHGGDFTHRFALAYPDRLAQAVSAPSEFTLLDPEQMYPLGVKPNLRAPSLQFHPEKFVKLDIAIVFKGSEGELFQASVRDFSREEGLYSRVAWRRVLNARSLEQTFREASKYLLVPY